jgi:hypothetical protein
MTAASELVKRLRAFRPTYGWPEEQSIVVHPTLGEAAAALIESQEEEIRRLREALIKSAEGWSNALELNLIPERHKDTARSLADTARSALQQKE